RIEGARRDRVDRHASSRSRRETRRYRDHARSGTDRRVIAALRKEFLLQWRTRAQAGAAFIFGATSLLLFSFAIGPNASALRTFSAGFIWLALLLSSTLTLADSFYAETENRALEGLLLAGASPRTIFYG